MGLSCPTVLMVPMGCLLTSLLPTAGSSFSILSGSRPGLWGWVGAQLARGLARAFKNLVSAYPRRTGKKTGPEREGTCKCHTAYHRQSWD